MQGSILRGPRLVALFLAGCLLFNYPVLALFDRPAEVFGLPLLFVYLFAAWFGLIALMTWIIERRRD